MGPAEARVRRQLAGDIYLGTKRGGGDWWLPRSAFEAHAHFLGPTRVGKSRALQLVAEQLIALGDCCVVVLDPHDGPEPRGGLHHALKNYCYGAGHAERLITVDLDDIARHGLVVGFNPMSRGRSLDVRAALAAENLRAVVGEAETNPVQLIKWSYNTFLGLHVADLAFGDASTVLDASNPAYREFFAEILRESYPSAAGDWGRLVEDDRHGRSAQSVFNFEVGSTKRRLDDYLNNEYIRRMLSSKRFAFDPGQVIRDRRVVLANLSLRDLKVEHQQKMLGTQLVHSFCRAAMDRRDEDVTPCYLIVDEFQKFLCPEVLEILSGGAKFGIHLILAHQFLSQLQDVAKQDWRYLDAVLGNPGLRVVFGGLKWKEAEELAMDMFNQDVDLMKAKQEIWGTVQLSHTEWVDLRTQMRAHADGRGWGSDSAHTVGGSRTHTSNPNQPAAGDVESVGTNFADAYRMATSGNSVDMTGENVAHAPVTFADEPFQELRSREFWGKDEQLFLLARELKNQDKQHAALYQRGGKTEYGRIGEVPNPSLTIDQLRRPDRERLLVAAALPNPIVAEAEVVVEESRERDRAFRGRLALPAHGDQLDAPSAIKRVRAARRRS
jgi:hypothetical protein